MVVFGLHVNRTKDFDLKNAREILKKIERSGHTAMVCREIAGDLPGYDELDYKKISVLLALGGDGTILRVARQCSQNGVPVLGINLGRLGFLTEIGLSKLDMALSRVLSGDYRLEKRMMLDAYLGGGKKITALNDVTVCKRDISRTIEMEYYIDGEFAERIVCDGIIVSTPTGSTGYSLSAGGPLLEPTLNCLSITPVCAHSLNSRPVVISAETLVELRHRGERAAIAADGEMYCDIGPEGRITIGKSPQSCEFIRFDSRSFYLLLREKFSV